MCLWNSQSTLFLIRKHTEVVIRWQVSNHQNFKSRLKTRYRAQVNPQEIRKDLAHPDLLLENPSAPTYRALLSGQSFRTTQLCELVAKKVKAWSFQSSVYLFLVSCIISFLWATASLPCRLLKGCGCSVQLSQYWLHEPPLLLKMQYCSLYVTLRRGAASHA